MATDCAPILADLFLYVYDYDFLQTLSKSKRLHLARKLIFTFHYINDLIISLDNKYFRDYVDDIYPPQGDHRVTKPGLLLGLISFH